MGKERVGKERKVNKYIKTEDLLKSFLEYPSLWVEYEIRELPASESEIKRILTDVLRQAKETILNEIKNAPNVDVRENVYGEWIHSYHYGLALPEHKCSVCGEWEYTDIKSKFCPNCGADMRKKVNNDE